MSAIQHLLQRWGFVKLGRYGLVLTPEDRILSMRPAVLDDGTGGRVVGWQDDDLAPTELPTWRLSRAGEATKAALPAVASRVAMPPIAAPTQPATPPEVTVVSVSEQASATVMPAAVAPEPVVDEDDWEWTIALARARVATEQTEVAAAAAAGPPGPAPRASLVRTRPMAAVAVNAPATSAEWPNTEPTGAIDHEDPARGMTRPAVAIPRVAPAAPAPAMPHGAAPTTVIPVPVLPTIQNTGRAGRLEPVVRTTPTASPSSTSPATAQRFAKGTGPVDQTSPSHGVSPPADKEASFSVGDRTTPGIALPPAARAVQLPSVKRRMLQRR